MTDSQFSRRSFLSTGGATIGSFAVAGSLRTFLDREAKALGGGRGLGYGPLRSVKDQTTGLELLRLPEGFTYSSFGWTGDEMADGRPTPADHDGMAVIGHEGNVLTICRNHELSSDRGHFGPANLAYDAKSAGGCSNITFDAARGRWLSATPSLAGTVRNCAGGPTPWGTWLSCEETTLGPGDLDDGEKMNYSRTHGWIFEVPPEGAKNPQPLKGMGRFSHEAVAVDPETGIVYETEDDGTAGFYRYIPNTPGKLADGGKLEMLKVPGVGDLRRKVDPDTAYDCEWVPIDNPEQAHTPGTQDEHGVFGQGRRQGGTTFARLEGCWQGNGLIYFVSTSGGDAKAGQIFSYDPRASQVRLVFESPSHKVLDSPDNIAVSPRGGMILCEDGDLVPQRLHGLSREGQLFDFASNNVRLRGERNGLSGDFRGSEWAGATFSPDGKWLFVNLQSPGITFAITGPWSNGAI